MKLYTLALFASAITLCSCKKLFNKDSCKPENEISQLTITTNSPVVTGWPIYLSATPTMTNLFHWSGPHGWEKDYQVYASNANEQEILNASFADSGTYKLELKNSEGCVESRGFANVKVIAPPAPPCTVTNNSSTSSVIGVGGTTYPFVNFSSSTYYIAQAIGSGQTLYFYFIGNVPPKPGVYKTAGYTPTKDTEVGCWISVFPHDFINQQGQDVYVNLVGGKTQVSFCNANFSNPLGSTIPKISARITQP
ncbi:MAG: hypothetical protein ABUL44_00420 [Flavobacterium sp.]